MKLDGLDHPKTLDFAARLDVILPQAIGHLELLWAFVAQKTPHGNVGKWPDGAIARAAQWSGEPTIFVTALCDAGFIDEHPDYRYIVHDWSEHAPRWVVSKLTRAKESFCKPAGQSKKKEQTAPNSESSEDCSADSSQDSTEGSSADSKPSLVKPSQAESSEGSIPPSAEAGKPPKSKRACQIPEDFQPNESNQKVAAEKCVSIHDELPQFIDYHRAKGSTMKDWNAALNTWLRNAAKFAGKSQGGQAKETPQQRGERMARERGLL